MRRMRFKIIASIFILPGVFYLIACATSWKSDNAESSGLFRQRWWSYYQRALTAAEARNYSAARADLNAALTQRDQDQRMARTYGMHFIDYFPYREMGVIHWLTGNWPAAEKALTRSIAQEPSAKARFYLDQVRKALLKGQKDKIKPPCIELKEPMNHDWSTEQTVTVAGLVSDPNFVSRVTVNDQPIFMEGASRNVPFNNDLVLPQGCQTIRVEAVNLAGCHSQQEVKVHIDSLGPKAVIDRIAIRDGDLWVSGVVLDQAGITALQINDRSLAADGSAEIRFNHRLNTKTDAIRIKSRDRLGNQSNFLLSRGLLAQNAKQPPLLAGLQLCGLFNADKQPPVVDLSDWQAQQTVYLDKIVLNGSVHDNTKVSTLTINKQPILPREGPMVCFTHIVNLKPGANQLIIEACDPAGNCTQYALKIERKIPKGLMLDERLRLAVFAFEQKGHLSAASFAFQDDFIHAIVQRQRFQVVERQRMDLILQEQKINRSDLVDTQTALHLGNLAAAQALIAGSIIETRTGIEIVGRMIDSETGDILCTADVYGEDKTLSGLRQLAQILMLKFHREFPLVDGLVINKKGDMIITDLTIDKLRAQRRLIIYSETPVKHPETGQFIGMDHTLLGIAKVTQASDALAKARLQTDADPSIHPRHLVVTQ